MNASRENQKPPTMPKQSDSKTSLEPKKREMTQKVAPKMPMPMPMT